MSCECRKPQVTIVNGGGGGAPFTCDQLGTCSIDALADVDTPAPADGQVLTYQDGQWVSVTPATGTPTVVQAGDTATFDMTVVEDPAGTFTVSGKPIIDPDPCNQLQETPDGLLVPYPTDDAITAEATVNPPDQFGDNGSFGNTPYGPVAAATITNPSTCRRMFVYYQTTISTNIAADPGTVAYRVQNQVTLPAGNFRGAEVGVGAVSAGRQGRHDNEDWFGFVGNLGPGESVSVSIQAVKNGDTVSNGSISQTTIGVQLYGIPG